MTDRSDFVYPRHRYYGAVKPENLVFNQNLQEFAQRVSYITNLETNGKLDPDIAFEEIDELWKQLKKSRKLLGIGQNPFQPDDGNAQS